MTERPKGHFTVKRLRELLGSYPDDALVVIEGSGPLLQITEDDGPAEVQPTPVVLRAARLTVGGGDATSER